VIILEKNLNANLKFSREHDDELFEKYGHKTLLVYRQKVVGVFDSYEVAVSEGVRLYGMRGRFMTYHAGYGKLFGKDFKLSDIFKEAFKS